MPKYSQQYGRCITDLLRRHEQSIRSAELFCEGVVSRSTIDNMTKGWLPSYDKAVQFLSFYPRDEAIACIESAGWPVPNEWRTEQDPIKALDTILEGMELRGKLTEQGRRQVLTFVEKVLDEVEQKRLKNGLEK